MSRREKTNLLVGDLIQKINRRYLVGCEVGVCEGCLSSYLLQRFPKLFLYMVDSYEDKNIWGRVTAEKAIHTAYKSTCAFVNRRSIVVSRSEQAVQNIADQSLDFVYIDADHTYKQVKNDLYLWMPKVKDGGILMGHDYDSRMEKKGLYMGVKRAVDEFAKHNGLLVQSAGMLIWCCSIYNKTGSYESLASQLRSFRFDEKKYKAITSIIGVEEPIIDLGAGIGKYVAKLRSDGWSCVNGIDGAADVEEFTNGLIKRLDLTTPNLKNKLRKEYDWALFFEVGEHISRKYEQVLIDNVCSIPRKGIIMSWGLPGQKGYRHVNCQSRSYIIRQFQARGFAQIEINTESKNILVFRRKP